MTHKVGIKGQVVIAHEIREKLGVQPGWVALQRLVADHVEIFFAPPEHDRSLKGSLAQYAHNAIFADAEWHRVKEEAWNRAGAHEDRES